jgi:hypothetical protein
MAEGFSPWVHHLLGIIDTDNHRTCILCGKEVVWTSDPELARVTQVYEHDNRWFINTPPGNIIKCNG